MGRRLRQYNIRDAGEHQAGRRADGAVGKTPTQDFIVLEGS
jgi:hypothetical protein